MSRQPTWGEAEDFADLLDALQCSILSNSRGVIAMGKTDFGLAVIGCGRWGQHHVRTAFELFGDGLRQICDRDPKAVSRLPDQSLTARFTTDVDAVLSSGSVSAVIIATPTETHFEIAKRCLTAGRHVLVEKPIALFSHQAEELEHIAERDGLTLMAGHVLLFHPAIRKIHEMMQEGVLGKLQYLYSNRLNLGSVRKEENILWSFAPHDVSVLRYLVGDDPIETTAEGSIFLQPGIHDVTITHLEYPNNVHAHIHVSWLHPFKEHRLVVIGDKSMVVFEDTRNENKLLLYPKGIDWIRGEPRKREENVRAVGLDDEPPLKLEQQHFADCVTKGERPLTDATSAIAILRTLEEAQRSLDRAGAVVGTTPLAPKRYAPSNTSKSAVIHPTAVIDENVTIGENTRVWHFSHIQSGAVIGANCSLGQNVNVGNNVHIGDHCKIQNNVSIYEGVELEDYVFCGPSMVFTNILNPRCEYPQRGSEHYVESRVRYGASIGANATILCGTTIGRFAFVAAGAVVTKDVPEFALVMGNPGRVVGWMSREGKRLDFSESTTRIVGDCEYTLDGDRVLCKDIKTKGHRVAAP